MKRNSCLLMLLLFINLSSLFSQQAADTSYNPVIPNREYARGQGPVVFIDEGHYNFHTSGGRYLPFARLLRQDGYQVEGYKGVFESGKLERCKILVISNALNEINDTNWYLPTPSAFTSGEIKNVRKWVQSGGSLFLIADHMPMGGAAAKLADTFGFIFTNGFAFDTANPGPAFFYRKENTLLPNQITNGRNSGESVNKVVTFTGQAIRIPKNASSILQFDKRYTLLESDTAWVFDKSTKYTSIDGWSQGAFMKYGKGRIVVFGEAAMFTAQISGPQKFRAGMNSDFAEENYKLLLNIMHWLDGKYH